MGAGLRAPETNVKFGRFEIDLVRISGEQLEDAPLEAHAVVAFALARAA